MIERTCILLLTLGLTWACSGPSGSSNSEAGALLAKTIQYHDPEGKWNLFSARILQSSQVTRLDEATGEPVTSTREREILLDIPGGNFEMKQDLEGYPLVRSVSRDGECASQWDKDSISAEEVARYRLDCPGAERMHDYFRYLIGLPMVLMDQQAVLRDSVSEVELNGEMLHVLTVDYPASEDRYTWQFYIHPETGALSQTRFFREEGDGSLAGEIIQLEKETEYRGMKKFGRFVWTYLDGAPLAVEDYTFQKSSGNGATD